ncbi:hypothetical protein BpHYR1_004781 [Brachionus plicatilis]|uniref:Uncharacterized protein n=1 Tax=Brachionus plicatilis TaxID=10195 RepID=A0A3M7SZP0_BRAPC|nr:hypothetical protein BpHYR1_004781 [Brachionus plicatilis]
MIKRFKKDKLEQIIIDAACLSTILFSEKVLTAYITQNTGNIFVISSILFFKAKRYHQMNNKF